jgi:hypothetical protein
MKAILSCVPLIALLAFAAGCDDDDPRPEGDGGGNMQDASPKDAATPKPDSGPKADAGSMADAGPDAGSMADASTGSGLPRPGLPRPPGRTLPDDLRPPR